MKQQITNRLNIVLNALNNVYVKGKENLGNLSGSIAIIEELSAMLSDDSITITTDIVEAEH